MEPKIIYQNTHYVVIDKPSGLLVHHTSYHHSSEPTVATWAMRLFPAVQSVGDDPTWRPGIVHRLDKDTSGVMVVALTQSFFSHIKKQFMEHTVHKEYYALVQGALQNKQGRIDRAIGIKKGTTKRTIFSSTMAKPAITDYVLDAVFKKNNKEYSLVKVMPHTGRTHQIRVHLASIQHPICGDSLYGGKTNAQSAPRLMLHAYSISFADSDNEQKKYSAPLPDIFTNGSNSIVNK